MSINVLNRGLIPEVTEVSITNRKIYQAFLIITNLIMENLEMFTALVDNIIREQTSRKVEA